MLNIELFQLMRGNCINCVKDLADESVDLIVTSPPYAERRADHYTSVSPDDYVEWFLPLAKDLFRILKPSGSFLLNLKSHCEKMERHLYVYDLVLAIKREAGFCFVDEYVWYKSALPRKWSHRLRDAWEPVWHFSKGKNFINHKAVEMYSDSAFANKRGYAQYNAVTGNVGGYHDIADQQPGVTYPDNVLYFPTSLLVKDKFPHPAKFPCEMIELFVKAFCPVDGVVLDPFMGSGMTALAALKHDRRCIGIELEEEYCEMTMQRLSSYVHPEEVVVPGYKTQFYAD